MKTYNPYTRLGLTLMAAAGLCGAAVVPLTAANAQSVVVPPAAMQQNLDSTLAKAVAEHDVRLAESVLARGANPNTLLSDHKAGGTVLHAAAADGRIDLVTCLLDHGADTVQRNTHLKTARDLAIEGGHAAIAEMLRKAEDGTYKPTTAAAAPVPVKAAVSPPVKSSAPKFATAVKRPITKTKASKSRTQNKSRVARKSKKGSSTSQARAYQKLKDYNYVKQNFGLGGSTYRSFKW